MAKPDMQDIIPIYELKVGMRVKTPDGRSKAVVAELREDLGCVLLDFSLIDGEASNANTYFGPGSSIKLVRDEG